MSGVRDQVRNMQKVEPRPYARRIPNECQPKDKHRGYTYVYPACQTSHGHVGSPEPRRLNS